MTPRVGLFDPSGRLCAWSVSVVPHGKRQQTRVRKETRQLAAEQFGKKWNALWLAGYRVGSC